MKLVQHLLNGLAGWLAGLLITWGFSNLWLQIFPVIERTGQGTSKMVVLSFILLGISPVAIAGGIIGGRLPREGGKMQQILYAALLGALFPLPFGCFLFWYTGW